MTVEYRVIVTFGTRANQTYSQVPCLKSAEKLKELALRLGYHDARIEEATTTHESKRCKRMQAVSPVNRPGAVEAGFGSGPER